MGVTPAVFVALLAATVSANVNPNVLYEWSSLDFEFPSDEVRQAFVANKSFVPENNIITGIKVSGDVMYLTVPRWRVGVPATLVSVPLQPGADKSPVLKPFPSWSLNTVDTCKSLQMVMSMEIDQYNRMWVLDAGRKYFQQPEYTDNSCPPKLVLLDLNNGGKELHRYVFPENVVSRNNSFLNDIVVGCRKLQECWAYISEVIGSKVIVYDFKSDRAWYASHSSMVPDPEAEVMTVEGQEFRSKSGVNGIALSPIATGFDRLYFCPQSSYKMYSVPTFELQRIGQTKDSAGQDLPDHVVTDHGVKLSQQGGMVMTAEQEIIFGAMNNNGVYAWNVSNPVHTAQQLFKDDATAIWPDTFAIDQDGYGYVTTNRLNRFAQNIMNFTEVNFRVIKFYIGSKSFMYTTKEAKTAAAANVRKTREILETTTVGAGEVETATEPPQDVQELEFDQSEIVTNKYEEEIVATTPKVNIDVEVVEQEAEKEDKAQDAPEKEEVEEKDTTEKADGAPENQTVEPETTEEAGQEMTKTTRKPRRLFPSPSEKEKPADNVDHDHYDIPSGDDPNAGTHAHSHEPNSGSLSTPVKEPPASKDSGLRNEQNLMFVVALGLLSLMYAL